MAFLGDLVLRLKAETADFSSDLGRAAYMVEKSLKQMESAATSLQGVLLELGASVSVGGLAMLAKSAIDTGDQFNKMSQKVGINVEALSALAFAASISDLSMEGMQVGLKKLATTMADASAGGKEQANLFKAIGVAYKDSAGQLRAPQQALLDIADKFAGMKDGAEKSAIAVKLFGRSGLDLIPLLNQGSAAIRKMTDEAESLGVVWTKEAAQGAEDFNDNMKRLKAMSEGLTVSFVSNFLPTLLKVQEAFLDSRTQAGSFYNQLKDLVNDRNKLEDWAGDIGMAFARVADVISTTWNTIALGIETVVAVIAKAAAVAAKLQLYTPAGWVANKASGGSIQQFADVADALASSASSSAAARAAGMANGKSYTDSMQATIEAWKKRSALEQIYGPGGAGSIPGGPKGTPDLSGLKQGLTPEQETKMYTNALQALEKEYFTLQGYGKVALLQYETEKGSLSKLTQSHKEMLLQKAREVDSYRTAQTMRAEAFKGDQAQLEIEQKGRDVLQEYNIATREANEQSKFQIDLIGRNVREQEMMNAMRQIDLDLRKQVAALPVVDADGNTDPQALENLLQAADRRRAAFRAEIGERQTLERDWITGAKASFNEYMDAATNAAASTKQLFDDAFKGMEDAFVEFAKTGKLSFKNLADSIIADIARIMYRQTVTPWIQSIMGATGSGSTGGTGLLGWLQGLGSSSGLFSSGASASAAASTTSTVATSFADWGDFAGAMAGGGTIGSDQFALVGENGPELFKPGVSGSVIPKDSVGGKTVNITFTVNSLDPRTAAAVIVENRDVITGVIRQAAAERGRSMPF